MDKRAHSVACATVAFTGTISGSPPNRIDGSTSFALDIGGVDNDFSGTWTASKQ